MVFVIVALVGVPLLVLAGMLTSSLITRRVFSSQPDVFRCKARLETVNRMDAVNSRNPECLFDGPLDNGLSARWQRAACHGLWVHDTLVLASGFWRARVRMFGVHFAEGTVAKAASDKVSRLGPQPVCVLLQLDDDTRVVLAAPESARGLVCGPYLVANLAAEVRRGSDKPAQE
jgi:hypothetical protein